MVPVGREQLDALFESLQLLRSARVEPPRAFLFAKFRPDALPYLKSHFLMEVEETFVLAHGKDEDEAKTMADAATITAAAVKIPVSEDILHFVLGGGLIANKDEAVFKLSTGDVVNVMLHRGVNVRISYEHMSDLTLANEDESMEAYLHKLSAPGTLALTQ